MFRKIDYGTDKKFEPIPIVRIKPLSRKYNDWDVIIGKSVLNINEKNGEVKSILELMKSMNKSI
jgi:hypothetical protein